MMRPRPVSAPQPDGDLDPATSDTGKRLALDELIVEPDAWPTIVGWLDAADGAQALPASPDRAAETLAALQVTTRSVLGSIALHAAGLVAAHGWLRHLGCGGPDAGDGLREWNASLGGVPLDPPLDGALVVALDALGGIFAINGGGLPADLGLMLCFAPDTQKWMPLEMRHSAFVQWSLSPQGEQFYADQQWFGWRDEVGQMRAGQVMSFYPPLGLETTSLDERSRRVVPGREMWYFLNELSRQTAGLPDGSQIRVAFE